MVNSTTQQVLDLPCKREIHTYERHRKVHQMKTYSIALRVKTSDPASIQTIEFHLQDLLESSILPALNLELIPLTLTVKNARG